MVSGARNLVLASSSQRRIDLLRSIDLDFEVCDPEVDEAIITGSTPESTALARAKVKAVAISGLKPHALVLAADTVVVLDGEVLPKATSVEEVSRMIGRLSGRTHTVVTAVAVHDPGSGAVISQTDEAQVEFRHLTTEEIDAYSSSGEGVGKAGGYAIQGLGGDLVASVRGDRETVIGLPTRIVQHLLAVEM